MRVALRHPGTEDLKLVGTGWSWSLFLGAGFLGLPLFFRGLARWGTLMLVLWLVQLALPIAATGNADTAESLLNLAAIGLCVYLGLRGNALSARHFVAYGYELANPDSPEARRAAQSWGI
jgi:hypothetical protein